MKLRHVLLLACAVGASGALLLAWDMHRRLKDAESTLLLKGADGASKPKVDGAKGFVVSSALPPDETTLSLLTVHSLGLLSLAFLFLAIFLLLISALREHAFALAIGGEPSGKPAPLLPAPRPEDKSTLPVVMPLAEVAQQEDSSTTVQQSSIAALQPADPPGGCLPTRGAPTDSTVPQQPEER